jgi:hypothetical protein
MQLWVSLDGPGATPQALADLAAALTQADLPATTVHPPHDGAIEVHTNPVLSAAAMVNCFAAYIGRSDSYVGIVVRGARGQLARVDAAIVASPFELLMVVNTLNPPVGMG